MRPYTPPPFEFVDANILKELNNLPAIVEQLEKCGYTCIAGKLELNTAFIRLKEIATMMKGTERTI